MDAESMASREYDLQYVTPGPRGKIIILNISPELGLHELKFSLKIVFMFLVITVKWQLTR